MKYDLVDFNISHQMDVVYILVIYGIIPLKCDCDWMKL